MRLEARRRIQDNDGQGDLPPRRDNMQGAEENVYVSTEAATGASDQGGEETPERADSLTKEVAEEDFNPTPWLTAEEAAAQTYGFLPPTADAVKGTALEKYLRRKGKILD